MTYEAWRISYQSSEQAARAAYAECARLQANIAEREKQVPVAFGLYSGWALKATYLKDHEACEQRDRRQLTADLSGSLEAYRVVPLYALPGAHPKPDCGEAGHDEGRCGNKQCLPGAQLAPSVPEDAPQGAQNVASSQDAWKTLAKDLLREIERQTCTHEETHRGGFVWEICDSCGAKWADDEGGKPEFKWPKVVERAHAMLAAAPEAKP